MNDERLRRIKDLREFCDYSIDELAGLLNIPAREYSDYESGKSELPIGLLYNIAHTLKVDPSVLLTGKMSKDSESTITYDGKGENVVRYEGYSFSALCTDFVGMKMQPMIVEITPDAKPEMVMHIGQELNYVLDGQLRVLVGTKEYYLRTGDSVYFDSSIPHCQLAMNSTAKFLTVILDE